MLTLICGGSGSGKSEVAESYALQYETGGKYYIATMTAGDDESLRRIKKHRDRRGDTFITLERGKDIGALLDEIKEGSVCLLECMGNLVANEMFGTVCRSAKEVADKVCFDVEALSRRAGHLIVVTNDIFSDVMIDICDRGIDKIDDDKLIHNDEPTHDDKLIRSDEICCGVTKGDLACGNLVHDNVTTDESAHDNADSDTVTYDIATYEYVKALGMINRNIAKSADEVIEVVCGKSIYHKGKMSEENKEVMGNIGENIVVQTEIADTGIKEIAGNDKENRDVEKGFILVTGGACQGKLEFAREHLGAGDYTVYDGVLPFGEAEDVMASDVKAEDVMVSDVKSDMDIKHGSGVIFNHLERYIFEYMDANSIYDSDSPYDGESLHDAGCLNDTGSLNDADSLNDAKGLKNEDEDRLYDEIISAVSKNQGCIIIGSEVGCGIVPMDERMRRFRDVYGRVMTRLAKRASQVWRVYCGIGERIG